MKRGIILSFAIIMILTTVQVQGKAMPQRRRSHEINEFLIDDGLLTYRGWIFTEWSSYSDPYGIKASLNASITETADVESLSEDIVKFDVSVNFNAEECYQKRDDITYSPSNYGIRYYDEDTNFIGTDATQYDYDGNVKKEDGTYSLFHAPQGASFYQFVAYFDSSYVYEWVGTFPMPFPEADEQNGFFVHNISDWSIGTDYQEDYTVSEQSTFGDYETWVLEPKSNFAGMDIFEDRIEFEKTSGLFLQQDSRFAETNVFDFKYHLRATEYEDIIMTPSLISLDPLSLAIGGGAVAAVAVIVIVIYKRRS